MQSLIIKIIIVYDLLLGNRSIWLICAQVRIVQVTGKMQENYNYNYNIYMFV